MTTGRSPTRASRPVVSRLETTNATEQPAIHLRSPQDVRALRDRLAADGVEIVEVWEEPEYVSVKCRDPNGYVVEASWEPQLQ